jgi:hypothetical protein
MSRFIAFFINIFFGFLVPGISLWFSDLNKPWTGLPTHRYCYLFHRQRVIKLLLFPLLCLCRSLTLHVTLEIEHYEYR